MKDIDKAIDALNSLTDWCMKELNVTEYDNLYSDIRMELEYVSYHITIDGIGVKDAIESTESSIKFCEEDGCTWGVTFYKKILQVLKFLED